MDGTRKSYPSDVGDDEWVFVAPYLTLMDPQAPQRVHELRDVFDGLRWMVRAGAPWRFLPNDFLPWEAGYQQTRRWLAAGRGADPTAVIFDSQTLQSTPESGIRAGYDGAERKRGAKLHSTVDTLGHLLARHVTSANEQDRAQVGALAVVVQEATGEHVELAFVDQGYTGQGPAEEAAAGWSKGASPGKCASAAWSVTANACQNSSLVSTSSPSPACCFTAPSSPLRQVHDML